MEKRKSGIVIRAFYTPISKILTNIDFDIKKWRNYIRTIEKIFTQKGCYDFKQYDEKRYLKINRSNYTYTNFENYIKNIKEANFYDKDKEDNEISYSFKGIGFKLSDHEYLYSKHILTWNVLHHYNYNGSNDYIDSKVVKHFNAKVLTEKARYSLIKTHINVLIEKNDFKCIALQECEYAIYNSIIQKLDKNKYTCRFIPQKIHYSKEGLYIESYGCALIMKGISKMHKTQIFVNPIERYRFDICKSGYRYIIANIDQIMYSSIHFPKCGNVKDLNAWKYYGYEDFKFILSKMKNMNEGFLVGDFNMPLRILNEFLSSFKDYNFEILAQNGVDYIIRVVHS
tara:strand:+ start:1252 stop:2274 length:1023 start_codon:yes stop_codon:yes gene_type:complete